MRQSVLTVLTVPFGGEIGVDMSTNRAYVGAMRVTLKAYPQPDGCVGIKVMVEVPEPKPLFYTTYNRDGSVASHKQYGVSPTTQVLYGDIIPLLDFMGTMDFDLPELVEGAVPPSYRAHNWHGKGAPDPLGFVPKIALDNPEHGI